MINIIEKETVNGVSVIFFEVGTNKFGATYFSDETALSELEQRQYSRWNNFKCNNSPPNWVGRPETKQQAKKRFNQMLEILKDKQVRIKHN